MKTVVSISLGSGSLNYDFTTEFLGQDFRVVRFGTDKDLVKAESLIEEWQSKADVVCLGSVREHRKVGSYHYTQASTQALEDKVTQVPVTTGARLREILQDWAIRNTQLEIPDYFNNSKILIFSGSTNYRAACILSDYTKNLTFADPVRQLGIPKFLKSLKALELYAAGTHHLLKWKPPHVLSPSLTKKGKWSHRLMRQAMLKADMVAATYEDLEDFGLEELAGKTVLTSSISENRLKMLGDKGIHAVVDYAPKLFDKTVGINVIEAMILAATEKKRDEITDDDYLEIITGLDIKPGILYPNGFKRKTRFAFVIHPLSQENLTQAKPVAWLSKFAPQSVMNLVEKLIAYSPPFMYSKIEGIKSPTGAETEGWLISVGGTPKEIMAHSPEFTYRRLLAAAKTAERLGAQIMGLGAFTKVVGDAGITVAKRAPLPITTGNSYSASGALWAANDACKRLGLVTIGENKKVKGKAMVVGATGAIGSVCARLLAKAVDEIYMVSPETAKLLVLKEDILRETPDAIIHLQGQTEKRVGEMDIIVTATSGAGKKILDIMKVKPGCVITDVARPLDIPASDVAKRPDVLVIESGEILLPGEIKMKDIGLPQGVAFACMAETIVLALEGRFDNFTLGRHIEWEKVKEIYQMGLKHGMKLASISGVNGVYSEEDLQRVRKLALAKRAEQEVEDLV